MKKLKYLFILLIVLCPFMNVRAANISIDKVVKNLNESEIISTLNELNENEKDITVMKNDSNIVFKQGSDEIMSMNYTDEYIEYSNPSVDSTNSDDIFEGFFEAIMIYATFNSVFTAAGFENKTLGNELPENLDYGTYGLIIESEHYEYEEKDENGEVISKTTGDILKHFKMSLDEDKIAALVNTYGVDYESIFGENDLVPTLKFDNITNNSVKITANANKASDDENDYYCEILRSTSLDGEYQTISNIDFVCDGTLAITDENLEPNTTYYYKAKVLGGKEYSIPLHFKTKSAESVRPGKNPNTGIESYAYAILLAIVAIVACKVMNKKSLFRRM